MANIYFNYFTEVEEHFRQARGGALFLLAPRDWALLERWKNSGIPLEAVLRGIDVTFDGWKRRGKHANVQRINSLAYCAPAVEAQAQTMANAAPALRMEAKPSFTLDSVRAFVNHSAAVLRTAGHEELAASLAALDLEVLYSDPEQLEQRLTAIEKQLVMRARAMASAEAQSEARRALDVELKPYRGKMTADQFAVLEDQFLERRLLETAGLPRLSLIYI